MCFHRSALALLWGVLGVIIILISVSSCDGNQPPVPPPKPKEVFFTEIRDCRWEGFTDGKDVFIWFIVDRSPSMFRDPVSETQRNQLYSLPGLFIYAGDRFNQILDAPHYRFSLHLSGPHTSVFPLEKPSDVPEWRVDKGEADTNEYGKALDAVHREMKERQQARLIVLVLTDGTYTQYTSISKTEEQKRNVDEKEEVKRSLDQIKREGAEVYVVLLPTAKERLPWEDFRRDKLVTEVYAFPEGLTDLGKTIFPPTNGHIQINWFSDVGEVIQLPDYFSRVNFFVSTLGGGQFEVRSHNLPESPIPLSREEVNKYFQGTSSSSSLWLHTKDTSLDVPPTPISVTLETTEAPLLGFYIIQDISTLSVTVDGKAVVNDETGTLRITTRPTFSGLFSVELKFSEAQLITGSGTLENGVAQFEWKPSEEGKPGDRTAKIVLRGTGNGYFNCGTITLPVKFQPLPLSFSVRSPCSIASPGLPLLCTSQFAFQYNPPGQNPLIYLCSPSPPPTSVKETPSCRTPFPDGSLKCPVPIVVTDTPDRKYCVRAEFADDNPCSDHPIVVNGLGNSERYTYTVRMPQCYLYHCGYDRVVFQWRDSPTSLATEVVWLKGENMMWQLDATK